MTILKMNARRFGMPLQYSVIALVLINACPSGALAQDGHSHTATTQHQEMGRGRQNNAAGLLKTVRESTERFKDVKVAEAEGYSLQFGCVSGSVLF